jgi:NADPH:quinone reductase
MKAVWLTDYGPPEVLLARETPDPVPGAGEVLVDVAAVSVTFIETLVRAGLAPWQTPGLNPPYVPGNGVGGTVAAVFDDVDPFWQGRRVVTTTGGSGGYAERVVVPVSSLIAVPAEVDLRDATALLADGRTAIGLVELAAPSPDEWVLVEAAAGGVGSLLVQLCRRAGARVVAAAGSERKLAVARDLGADAVVDYSTPAWTSELPSTMDVIFDGVGGEIGAAALATLRPGGRFVSFGVASGGPTTATRDDVTTLGFQALGSLAARASELTSRALVEAEAGRLRPVIGQVFRLDDAASAHAAIETRATIGKTLLVP